jgi:hypothetical protein
MEKNKGSKGVRGHSNWCGGGGLGLGVGNEELKGRNRRGWRPLLKYASRLVFYICEP